MPEQELLSIRLADGRYVEWTPEQIRRYDGDWKVNLRTLDEAKAKRLLACLAHDDDTKCTVCGGDA